jgi:transposase
MYRDDIINQWGKVAILIRESRREGKKVIKRTVANITHLPHHIVEVITNRLRTPRGLSPDHLSGNCKCRIVELPSGHVTAIQLMQERLGIQDLLNDMPNRERDITLGLIAGRIVEPSSKLAAPFIWNGCSLAVERKLQQYDENDIYLSLDSLSPKWQPGIQKMLSAKHIKDGDYVFIDMTSSYYEGDRSLRFDRDGNEISERGCSLIRYGYSRDRVRGRPQVNYVLVTDGEGRPVAVEVYPGNTADSKVFMPAVRMLREDFGLRRFVMVGDRGMVTGKDIALLKEMEGVGWITALRGNAIRKLAAGMPEFVDRLAGSGMFEFSSPLYDGERLVACLNPGTKEKQEKTRQSMIKAAELKLAKVKAGVAAGRLKVADQIKQSYIRALNNGNVIQYFSLDRCEDGVLEYSLKQDHIARQRELDGVYVIRTSVPAEALDAAGCVRKYKALSEVEFGYRTVKGVQLLVRPIYHHLDDRIRSHIFAVKMSYYVLWHMRRAWLPLTYGDEELDLKETRDPVKPAEKSESAKQKASTGFTTDGTPVRSFQGVMEELKKITTQYMVFDEGSKDELWIPIKQDLNKYAKRALDLIRELPL